MHYIIYKTTNNINGKYYIGQHITDNLDDGYIGSGVALSRAIKKYGKDNFTREILATGDNKEMLNELEAFYVGWDEVNDKNCYNLKTGGGSCGLLSKETRQKQSVSLKKWCKNNPRIGEKNPNYKELTENQIKQIKEIEFWYCRSPHTMQTMLKESGEIVFAARIKRLQEDYNKANKNLPQPPKGYFRKNKTQEHINNLVKACEKNRQEIPQDIVEKIVSREGWLEKNPQSIYQWLKNRHITISKSRIKRLQNEYKSKIFHSNTK
jgi:hypothetical protein